MRAAWTLAATIATSTANTISISTFTTLLLVRPAVTRAMSMSTTTTTAGTDNKAPTLKGVVFDMDDTLVRSNLDIRDMYKKVFGTDPPESFDILEDIASIDDSEELARAYRIIEGIEEESRKNMTLMHGCVELLTWLRAHDIPKALVTRNNRKTTDAFCELLKGVSPEGNDLSVFDRIITRDDTTGAEGNTRSIPPKPDPTAMNIIASECFGVEDLALDGSGIVMVGDSIANDIGFGKNAGVSTVLLVGEENFAGDKIERDPDPSAAADTTISDLTELPKNLWKSFSIGGPLGNTPEANKEPLHGRPAPLPESDLSKSIVSGGPFSLEEHGAETVLRATDAETNGNTALIWAAESGNARAAEAILDHVTVLLGKAEQQQQDDDATPQMGRLREFANHRGFLGATAVNRAARRGHTDVLRVLLSSRHPDLRFDVDSPNDKLQHPLHFAAFKKNPEALEYLLTTGGANPWVLDRKGRTPLEDTSCETCKSLLREAMKNYLKQQ